MTEEVSLAVEQLTLDCDILRKSLSKGSLNLILVPEMRARLHRILEAADTLRRDHPEDSPAP